MANDLQRVTGFFYQRGSRDYPSNFDPNDPFGFDDDSHSKAVFKYSINDVEKSFNQCRELTKIAFYDAGNTNILLAENVGGIDNEDIDALTKETSENYTSWQASFRILECIFKNQATVSGNASAGSGFDNKGDELLGSETIDNQPNEFYVPQYVKGSFGYTLPDASKRNRIQNASFTVEFNNAKNVVFNVAYDADYFVERESNIRYEVYRYEDTETPDEEISPEEFDKQIVKKLFEILQKGKYKKYQEYKVNKRLSDTEVVEEQFFVFSTVYTEMTDEILKKQIKQYLENKYEDQAYLRYHYPTLFSQNKVEIIPLYDNTIETISGGEYVVHPLSIINLSSALTEFGHSISISNPDYRPTEIFHVGPGSGWVPGNAFRFNFPLLAVEYDTASGIIAPISKRFPSYRPIYGDVGGVPDDAGEFHFIIITLLSYLMGTNKLTEEFKNAYSIIEETSSSKRKRITFTFANDLWDIYGPVSAGN